MSARRGRSRSTRHADWLRLIDVSGPFLSLRVLAETFPQGLDADDPEPAALLREGYAAWEANRRLRRPDRGVHRAWALLVLEDFLDYGDGLLAEGPAIPETVKATLPEHRLTLRPDFAVGRPGAAPALLVHVHAPEAGLERAQDERGFHASPAERMRLLLRGSGVRSGLVTNGAQWMLVHQPADRTATFATWESDVLAEEPEARCALRSLLGARRLVGVADADTLDGLFERSRDDEREVTDQLGAQTRRAVELLVDAIDRADRQAGGALLAEESLERIYEAAVAMAMRTIFLLAAEARGLMPDEGPWVESYAVTPIREQLRTVADRSGEELLDRRFDAWPRLLATFRAVHGGVEHDRIRLPGYGGGLFDPTRYPFLEGAADMPLRISNRVILHFLDALQTLEVDVPGGRERRPLSFRALGVEQVGHVYEGLLDHEAVRSDEPAVGLAGTNKKEPEIALPLVEEAHEQGDEHLLRWLKEETGRSVSALRHALEVEPDPARVVRLRAACDNDESLVERVLRYLPLVRDDAFGAPTVYRPGAVYVTSSTRRRSTGTHYTPPSLTEPIVRHALEPVVYRGPAEGLPPEEWTLKRPAELLDLKVCDIAMGSAAFLVAACRYLAARLVEAWDKHPDEIPEAAGADPEERDLRARRLVAERCLYGVDKNPLAVDIAKVSLWLVTLRKDRPFTFVDHTLRHGDSLLGLTSERELLNLSLRPDGSAPGWMLDVPRQTVREVLERVRNLRERVEMTEAIDLRDVDQKRGWLADAARASAALRSVADLVSGAALAAAPARDEEGVRALIEAEAAELAQALRRSDGAEHEASLGHIVVRATEYLEAGRAPGHPEAPLPFHWILEFPEVFKREPTGFDAIVGNPPFVSGKNLRNTLGNTYRQFLVEEVADGRRGSADLVVYFMLRAHALSGVSSAVGLVCTNTIAQGDSREVGLEHLETIGSTIYRATKSRAWPGEAALYVSEVWLRSGPWSGASVLDGQITRGITAYLDPATRVSGKPFPLAANAQLSYIGSFVLGSGFLLMPEAAARLIEDDPRCSEVLQPFLTGEDLNRRPNQSGSRWVINFQDWPIERARSYEACWAIIESEVRPDRQRRKENGEFQLRRPLPQRYWQYADKRPALYRAIDGLPRVLVGPQTAKWWNVSFVPPGWVYSHALTVFAFDDDAHAAVLSSTFHDAWARKYSGSLETRLRYSPTDCFENFFFPGFLDSLDQIGDRYHRERLMSPG